MTTPTPKGHTESCFDYAFSLAVENHQDATGEDLYELPLAGNWLPAGARTFQQVTEELRAEAAGYYDGLLDCSCAEDAAWYAEHGRQEDVPA